MKSMVDGEQYGFLPEFILAKTVTEMTRRGFNTMTKTPQCIAIFGRSGSGKSTFARKLADHLKLPLFHLDKIFFTENWTPRDYEEFLGLQQTLVNQPQWIIDGNSHRSLEMRFKRADLVIFFNYSRWVCLFRVFKRLFDKDPRIDDRAPGCRETVRWPLLTYLWTYDHDPRIHRHIQSLCETYPLVNFITVTTDEGLCALEEKLMGKAPGQKSFSTRGDQRS